MEQFDIPGPIIRQHFDIKKMIDETRIAIIGHGLAEMAGRIAFHHFEGRILIIDEFNMHSVSIPTDRMLKISELMERANTKDVPHKDA